ncbi:uncharacterized protein LOC128819649 [Vidua macroura]|uniref:uncharacterized protein LOC128819649 n=1 Tax=Vidua macroura TaxID=187451 RepID=UPI0023A908AF|nr:uncharacterized protein LOC128819649 [Vidua macroura]
MDQNRARPCPLLLRAPEASGRDRDKLEPSRDGERFGTEQPPRGQTAPSGRAGLGPAAAGVYPFIPPRNAAPSAPASSLHPERSEPRSGGEGRTQGRLCPAALPGAPEPCPEPRAPPGALPGAPSLSRSPARSPAAPAPPPPPSLPHHAGHFHPDVFRHHRPGGPVLHHLHALKSRRRGRCGSAAASPAERRPASARCASLGAFWNSVNPCEPGAEHGAVTEPAGPGTGMGEHGRGLRGAVPLPGRG